jgi:hypothetical protein
MKTSYALTAGVPIRDALLTPAFGLQRQENLCYDSAPRIIPESVVRAALWRFEPHAPRLNDDQGGRRLWI